MSIKGLLGRILPPQEVKDTCAYIEAFMAENAERAPFCLDVIKAAALGLAKDSEMTIASIRNNRMKIDELGLILVHNVLTRQLEGGWNHSHRGRLSLAGGDMLKLWDAANNRMEELGYQTQEETKTQRAGLMESIASMG